MYREEEEEEEENAERISFVCLGLQNLWTI